MTTLFLALFRLPLMRFSGPEMKLSAMTAETTWGITSGLLVSRGGRETGLLRIRVERQGRRGDEDDRSVARVSVEVEDFDPSLQSIGGMWLYRKTQLRLHESISERFFQSLKCDRKSLRGAGREEGRSRRPRDPHEAT